MKLRIVKAAGKKDIALLRCFLILVLCCVVIFGYAVISNIVSAVNSTKNIEYSPNFSRTVIIDPGHGGPDGGAIGYNGVVEKGVNLDISLKLRDLFKSSGFDVIMTREDDTSIFDEGSNTIRSKKVSDIHNRAKIISDNPDSVFLSIHQNKFEQSQYSGTQVFYSKNNDKSKTLADNIQHRVRNLIQPENDRVIKPAGKNLYLLYHAKSPAVMVECGFLSNPEESKKLTTAPYQKDMAFSIYCGTLEYMSGIKPVETNNK